MGTGEMDPRNPDTDGDGIIDGLEDADRDGIVDANESDPTVVDTDGDCIPDGLEDSNLDGIFSIALGESLPFYWTRTMMVY